MSPTTTDVGTYTVRIKFELTSDSTMYSEQTFLVDVYPATVYDAPNITTPCGSRIWPMVLGNGGVDFLSGDVSSDETRIIICGNTKQANEVTNTAF
jgi:hypothetical protein